MEPQLLNLAFKLLGKLAKSPDTTRSDRKIRNAGHDVGCCFAGRWIFLIGRSQFRNKSDKAKQISTLASWCCWKPQVVRICVANTALSKHQEVGLILDQPGSMKQAAWPFCKTSGHRRPKVELKQNDVFPFSHVFFCHGEIVLVEVLPSASIARV